MLEPDALAIVKTSEFFASLRIVNSPLKWDNLKPILAKGAGLQLQAWQVRKSQLSLQAMMGGFKGAPADQPEIIVKGGSPVWQFNQDPKWGVREYVPGPFKV